MGWRLPLVEVAGLVNERREGERSKFSDKEGGIMKEPQFNAELLAAEISSMYRGYSIHSLY